MSVVPYKQGPKIVFFEVHLAPWDTNAVAIGTTAPAIADLTTKTQAARAAFDAQQVALLSAKNATATLKTASRAMADAGAAVIDQVRAKARSGGDAVYNLAKIPVPATPATKGNPGTPYDFRVELFQDGSLELKFKCNNPAGTVGTMYQVYRRAGGEAQFTYVGGNGARKFTDNTIPAGVTQVTYQIQAVRSTAVGNFAQFNVNFGTAANGGVTASVVETPVRLAA